MFRQLKNGIWYCTLSIKQKTEDENGRKYSVCRRSVSFFPGFGLTHS